MKNSQWKMYLCYLPGLLAMACCARAVPVLYAMLPNRDENTWWLGIGAAAVIFGLAIAAHCLAKGRRGGYWLSYAFNAIGTGGIIGILYGEMGWTVEVPTLLYALLPAAVLGAALCLNSFIYGKRWRKAADVAVLILNLILIVGAIVIWVKWHCVFGSFAFFCGICQLFFQMACLIAGDKPEGKWRYLSFSGFWAFAVIAVVVIIVLSEGDILDGLDFDLPIGDKKKKAKKM